MSKIKKFKFLIKNNAFWGLFHDAVPLFCTDMPALKHDAINEKIKKISTCTSFTYQEIDDKVREVAISLNIDRNKAIGILYKTYVK